MSLGYFPCSVLRDVWLLDQKNFYSSVVGQRERYVVCCGTPAYIDL